MSSITLDKLYEHYNVLSDAKEKISEYENEFKEAVQGTTGGAREKKLSAQIIAKFFKHFPSLQDKALEAIIDICEDDDASIRIAAMKTLPIYCKDNKHYLLKVSDILTQLLQLEDPQEYNIASSSLLQILKSSPVSVLTYIFNQIKGTDTEIREKCIKFLITKVKGLDKSILSAEVEDVIIAETKKILEDATAGEFIDLMAFLKSTRLSQSFTGQQELVELAALQAELDRDFVPIEEESNNADRLITCIKFVLPYFSAKVESNRFVMYICDQVLPQWEEIGQLDKGELLQLVILRQLAEISTYCGKLDNPSLHVVNIYQKLKEYMPPPPEDVEVVTMPHFDFTIVECLLYAFHKLARQCPDFLTHDPDVLKDFRARLMYFSRGAQGCSKALSNNLEIKDKNLTDDDLKKKKILPKLLNNINTLIKDLFYKPPKYQSSITLSFKYEEAAIKIEEKHESSQKRHVPITFDTNGDGKSAKMSRGSDSLKLYSPPSGKFSGSFQGSRSRIRTSRGGGSRGWTSTRQWRK